ncbi:DUF1842 domain-containing protein [Pseudomonas chlororaphis]|uniref:DUF1842 domain-containing protein n=1 Tax=Pseudomonas TaxID=286 RepID=UPI0005BEC62C|nr:MULTISPECIES: DUF1842 domain-containing protein [Pseudomonas]AJO77815.1 hypothetical protein TO66_11110 [Pseudomonas sp. MRSN 12121]MCB2256208.1 DUF1842 domain-containing protein [Pseudomonas chlororaphis]
MQTGLFHTRLHVTTALLGAPVLTLDLLVNTVQKKVSGVARVFKSTYPPVHFFADVWGDYSRLQLHPSTEGHIVLTLAGNPSGPTSQIGETFHLHGILGLDWASGFASYKYCSQGNWQDVQHATVSQASTPHPEPVPHHPVPLYAVAVQQAQGSGDLAQLKAVVRQGEQQLASSDALRSALQQLNAEIARLEAR